MSDCLSDYRNRKCADICRSLKNAAQDDNDGLWLIGVLAEDEKNKAEMETQTLIGYYGRSGLQTSQQLSRELTKMSDTGRDEGVGVVSILPVGSKTKPKI